MHTLKKKESLVQRVAATGLVGLNKARAIGLYRMGHGKNRMNPEKYRDWYTGHHLSKLNKENGIRQKAKNTVA